MEREVRRNGAVEALETEYSLLIMKYVNRFCDWINFENPDVEILNNHHDLIISINSEYFLSFDEIRYILRQSIPAERFFKWFDYCIELGMLGLKPPTIPEFIAKDFKPKTKKEIRRIKTAQSEVDKAKVRLEKLLHDNNRS